MTKSTLANLYRQATRDAADSVLPDADILLALARGERPADAERIVTEVAQSALRSDLLHFTRALEPASANLSCELAATFGSDDFERTVHRRTRVASTRMASGRRPVWQRVAVGLAAAMVAGVALWSQQGSVVPVQTPVATNAAPSSDRIFASFDERALVGKDQADEIFNGDFRGDLIFRSSGG